ncbi:fatty acyl-AMP ligase [Streptomyces sp. BBFR115]|uniref:fatty acyl-AMP ligase n=1 Tax=Streptomyces sp. BBFR115 TaxID=3448173 RepID=UPI003F76345C
MSEEKPPTGTLLTDHLAHWAAVTPHTRAFTFVDFPEADSLGRHRSLTWRALDLRVRAVAEALARTVPPGERAALVLPQGLDYVAAFLGCLYAGVTAVPLFTPDLPGHEGRLAAVLADCEPACLLTDTATADRVLAFTAEHALPETALLTVDGLTAPALAEVEPPRRPAPDDIAYLQYTSGSTRTPAGVMITHANVVANARQGMAGLEAEDPTTTAVGWLPLFHDMGLVLSVAAPVVGGLGSVLMDPVNFLLAPERWLWLLGSAPRVVTAAPNFAYDYCVARIDADTVEELDLSGVSVMLNGSEPVRPATLDRFRDHFAPAGLAPEALCPGYGLAEATVFVAADPPSALATGVDCDPDALTEGRVVPAADPARATRLMLCGAPSGQRVRIVAPDSGVVLGEDAVGEIQVCGPNVGAGYWKKAALSAEVFGTRAPGEADDGPGWLRTGDLGALHGGALLVTGRLKDLIIVDGRNHYPQDIEETVQQAVEAIRPDRLAAVALPGPDGAADRLVVIAEHRRRQTADAEEALTAARAAVARRHGLRLDGLRLVAPGSVPRTSSGKISRAATRSRLLSGGFDAVGSAR